MVLYLLSGDATKANGAEALLKRQPIISVQVLNEVTNVCVRKLEMNWDETGEFLGLVRSFCKVTPLTADVHDRARQVAEQHRLSFYDACIVAAASLAGCQVLYAEDTHHGLVVGGSLSIHNPFLPPEVE